MDEEEKQIINTMPFNPLVNEDHRRQLEEQDCGMQFSHGIEEQLGGQLKAGLVLTDVYGDTSGSCYLNDLNVEMYWATRAIKP